MDPKALYYKVVRKQRAEKICLHPDQHQCQGKIIKAHTISKSAALKQLAIDGHILMFSGDDHRTIAATFAQGYAEPIKVGINKASTFTGFCSYHDDKAFQLVDDPEAILNIKEATLLSFRTFAREFYAKKGAIAAYELLLKEDHGGRDVSLLKHHMDSNKAGLNDLLDEAPAFFSFIKTGIIEFDFMRFSFDGDLAIACSGGFFPEFDFQANKLQDLSDKRAHMNKLWVNVIPRTDCRTDLVFLWRKKHTISKQFVKSFEEIPNNRKGDALVWLVFGQFENLVIAPTWWNTTGPTRKLVLGRRFYEASNLFVIRTKEDLLFGPRRYVDWTLVDAASNIEGLAA